MAEHTETDPTKPLGGAVVPVVAHACTVVVVEGPDAPERFRVDDVVTQRVLIGQSPVCAIRLKDPTVSRRHAALDGERGPIRFVDLDSSNGSFVGQLRVRDVFLTGGEIVRVGATTLRIEIDAVPHLVAVPEETSFQRVVGASREMRRLYPIFAKLAVSDVAVLIEGETGTGKDLLAESLHEASPRKHGPFVVLDCTTVSPALIEAELFGHERGAFTGAVESRKGLLEEAHGGTLFIDEIGDLDLALQSKLLRAIEKREIRRVGGKSYKRVDVRIVAATRRDLDHEVQARRFRDDLFYRLAVARVELPPLRRRQGDIALLTRRFWHDLGGDDAKLSPEVIRRFEEYAWPGNVRELHNAVALQLAVGDVDLLVSRVPTAGSKAAAAEREDFIDRVVREGKPLVTARQEVVTELEQRYMAHMLERYDGHVGRAAAASGIGRRYFQMLRAKR